MTSLRGGYRVAIVASADLMTTSAQNAFLKTLEEPAPRTLLVLVTARPSRLAATLRSRCQRIEIPRPGPVEALDWLRRNWTRTRRRVSSIARVARRSGQQALRHTSRRWRRR